MGLLTDDMTRLCGEINALRRARGIFMKDLEKETRGRKIAVSEMRANFAFARGGMVRKTKAFLSNFVSSLKCGVGQRRRQVRADLAGAHRAWLAPVVVFEKQGTVEAPLKAEKKSKRKRA